MTFCRVNKKESSDTGILNRTLILNAEPYPSWERWRNGLRSQTRSGQMWVPARLVTRLHVARIIKQAATPADRTIHRPGGA